jgi:hypothetical protein
MGLQLALFVLSALPAVAIVELVAILPTGPRATTTLVLLLACMPAYIAFAISLMASSALALRALGWRPPRRGDFSIAALEAPLINWGRYMVISYIVSMFCGPFFQATPLWNWYLRLNGATIGHGAWINSRGVTDHSNLVFGNGVVIGSGVHLSAHTVERGVVKIAPVTIGRNSTIGVNCHVQIGVTLGANVQLGSLSVVPKFAELPGPGVYVGVPARPLDPHRVANTTP